nr:MAG TPA: hypothetical protein [Caudoviricetes sp.]
MWTQQYSLKKGITSRANRNDFRLALFYRSFRF